MPRFTTLPTILITPERQKPFKTTYPGQTPKAGWGSGTMREEEVGTIDSRMRIVDPYHPSMVYLATFATFYH